MPGTVVKWRYRSLTNPNRYAILLGKRKQEGAYQNMSQAKVDRYKEEKKNAIVYLQDPLV